jgi:hypothetical protein
MEGFVRLFQLLSRTASRATNPAASASADTLEVVVRWGEHAVLQVAHSSPPRAFHVGDTGGDPDAPAIDFALDRRALGSEHMPLALVDGEQVRVLVPAGARAQLQLNHTLIGELELAAQGKLHDLAEPAGARAFVLPRGATAWLQLGELQFVLTLGNSENASSLAPAREVDWKGQRWTLASFGAHLGCLLLFMLLPPTQSVLALGEVDSSQHLVNFVIDGRERQQEESFADGLQGGSESADRQVGDEGRAGDPQQTVQPNRGAARGHAQRPASPHATVAPDPASAGIIGILRSAQLTAPMAFTGEQAEGNAVADVYGNVLGPTIGASFGAYGSGMIGTGHGGGGDASGTVGSGGLGTVGSRDFGAGGIGTGYGRGAGGFGDRRAHVPPASSGKVDIHGSLAKEVIRRVIQRHLPEVRACYQQRLNARPDLQGRLAVKFMIDGTGLVRVAAKQASDLHDDETDQCIVSAVKRWTFPQPEGGGVVTVTYPFVLTQM